MQRESIVDNSYQPLVSVIIRSIDRPELKDALRSVARQIYPNIEVVLVNAKGPGHIDYGAWCGSFPLHIISVGSSLHRSKAANLGLEYAKGDMVVFLDDDDWFLPHHLQSLVQVLLNNDGVLAAYSSVECVQQNKDGTCEQVFVFNQPFDRTKLFIENYIPIHAILFRRMLIDEGCRFDESLDVYEDWDFWIQLARKTDFVFINSIGAVYRVGAESGFGITGDNVSVKRGLSAFFNNF